MTISSPCDIAIAAAKMAILRKNNKSEMLREAVFYPRELQARGGSAMFKGSWFNCFCLIPECFSEATRRRNQYFRRR